MCLVLPSMGGKMDMRCGFNVSQGEPGRIQENISNVFPAQRWLVKVLFGPTSSMRWHVQQRMDMAPSCHSAAMNYLWWKELLELYVQHRQKQVGFSELGSCCSNIFFLQREEVTPWKKHDSPALLQTVAMRDLFSYHLQCHGWIKENEEN